MRWRNTDIMRDKILRLVKPGAVFVVFDTETTGLDFDNDKIIQFSALRYQVLENGSFGRTGTLDQYINPGFPLPAKIVEITQIEDHVLQFFKDETAYVDEIFAFLQSGDFVLAYNSPFDLKMLEGMQRRCGTNYYIPPCLDALIMARDCVSPEETVNYKLGSITQWLYPDRVYQFHSAIEDVRATAVCFKRFVSMYNEMQSYDSSNKIKQHLEWAFASVNDKAKSQQRIKVSLDPKNKTLGEIFFDCVKKEWNHKQSKTGKQLFEITDLKNLEEQVMNRYAWKYNVSSMDELASEWMRDQRRRQREEKLKTPQPA